MARAPQLVFRMIARVGFLVFVVGNFCGDVVETMPFPVDPVCELPRGEICIDLRECDFFVELMNRSPIPRPSYVIQLIIANQCGFNADQSPKVCCLRPRQQSTEFIVTDEEEEEEVKEYEKLDLMPRNCGTNPLEHRITRGTKAALMEFPWMALLIYEDDDELDSYCGGTLINERYVLTAAHCVVLQNVLGVRLGDNYLLTKVDCDETTKKCSPPIQDFLAEDVIPHPKYTSSNFANDIALIRLDAPADLNYENVRPICLPLGEDAIETLDGKYGDVIGWGRTEKGFKSNHLVKVRIPIWNTDSCRRTYIRSIITNKQLCAGGTRDGKDSCGGDSGGPLMMSKATADGGLKYVQHGIVSYGPRYCGSNGKPAIYTRVGSYIDWILENINP